MKRDSSLTFRDLTENLAFVKVIYNDKVIYDDISYLSDDFTYNEDGETLEHLNQILNDYGDKIVYEMNIEVVEQHHCILTIEGEE